MKEITKEQTTTSTYTVYVATDGTEFHDAAECKKYEQSAAGVIRAKVSKLIAGDTRNTEENAWTLMGGDEEHDVIALTMENFTDLDTVKQFLLYECPWYNSDQCAERKKEIFNIIDVAYKNEDAILFGINIDGNYYFINSRQNLINNLSKFGK